MENLIDKDVRDTWCQLKWEYIEKLQEQEPNLQLGWYNLLVVAQILDERREEAEDNDKDEESGL